MLSYEHDYTADQTFKPGDRVELHPGCDLWMRGAKFGTVVEIQTTGHLSRYVWVAVDRAPRGKQIRPYATERLRHVR